MKKTIIIIYLFVIGVVSYGQTYNQFLDNIGWCLEEYFGTGSWLVEYENNGDTVVNSTNYTKLLRDKTTLFLVREDTIQKKTWVILPDSSIETLLYDFNLTIGNQITLNYVEYSPTIYQVDIIDTISTSMGNRKRIRLTAIDTADILSLYWVEGIGSTYGPIYLYDPTYFFHPLDSSGHCLICAYKDIGVQSYLGTCGIPCLFQSWNKCYSFSSNIKEEKSEFLEFDIYYITPELLLVESKNEKIEQITIFSIDGRLIEKITNVGKYQIIIYTNKWSAGIYLCEVITDKNNIIKRKINK